MSEIIKSENTALATASAIDFDIPEGCICTIDLTTDEGAMKATNAFGSAASLDEYLKEAKSDEFVITDIVTKNGVRAQSDNEPCMDVILITADGECLFTQSSGIYNSVVAMVAACGIERIHRGVRVKRSTIRTRGGNELKQLRILGFAS